MNQRHTQHKLLIFNEQVHQAILKIVQKHLPLEISARDLDDKRLWEIVCHASVEQGYIESSCRVLKDAPSGNTVRAHLIDALGDGDQALDQLEEELNRALQAQLPRGYAASFNRRLGKRPAIGLTSLTTAKTVSRTTMSAPINPERARRAFTLTRRWPSFAKASV
jgi:hypothetical protein